MPLYHYTDADGLLGLLGKPKAPAEIWMSQIQYLNDHKEWWHAYEFIGDSLWTLKSDARPIVKSFADYWHQSLGIKNHNNRPTGAFQRTFIFSVSEAPDLLSQWRGYTPNGGYCIEFNPAALQSIAQKNGFQLRKCIYEDQEKQELVQAFFNSLVQELLSGAISPEVEKQIPDTRQAIISSAGLKLQQQFGQFACYFKHSSFREEKEWRLFGVVPAGGTDPRERWRTRRDLILPYCAIALPDSINGEPIINGIIVGPGVDFKLAEHSIKYITYGRLKNLTVSQSQSTLRR